MHYTSMPTTSLSPRVTTKTRPSVERAAPPTPGHPRSDGDDGIPRRHATGRVPDAVDGDDCGGMKV